MALNGTRRSSRPVKRVEELTSTKPLKQSQRTAVDTIEGIEIYSFEDELQMEYFSALEEPFPRKQKVFKGFGDTEDSVNIIKHYFDRFLEDFLSSETLPDEVVRQKGRSPKKSRASKKRKKAQSLPVTLDQDVNYVDPSRNRNDSAVQDLSVEGSDFGEEELIKGIKDDVEVIETPEEIITISDNDSDDDCMIVSDPTAPIPRPVSIGGPMNCCPTCGKCKFPSKRPSSDKDSALGDEALVLSDGEDSPNDPKTPLVSGKEKNPSLPQVETQSRVKSPEKRKKAVEDPIPAVKKPKMESVPVEKAANSDAKKSSSCFVSAQSTTPSFSKQKSAPAQGKSDLGKNPTNKEIGSEPARIIQKSVSSTGRNTPLHTPRILKRNSGGQPIADTQVSSKAKTPASLFIRSQLLVNAQAVQCGTDQKASEAVSPRGSPLSMAAPSPVVPEISSVETPIKASAIPGKNSSPPKLSEAVSPREIPLTTAAPSPVVPESSSIQTPIKASVIPEKNSSPPKPSEAVSPRQIPLSTAAPSPVREISSVQTPIKASALPGQNSSPCDGPISLRTAKSKTPSPAQRPSDSPASLKKYCKSTKHPSSIPLARNGKDHVPDDEADSPKISSSLIFQIDGQLPKPPGSTNVHKPLGNKGEVKSYSGPRKSINQLSTVSPDESQIEGISKSIRETTDAPFLKKVTEEPTSVNKCGELKTPNFATVESIVGSPSPLQVTIPPNVICESVIGTRPSFCVTIPPSTIVRSELPAMKNNDNVASQVDATSNILITGTVSLSQQVTVSNQVKLPGPRIWSPQLKALANGSERRGCRVLKVVKPSQAHSAGAPVHTGLRVLRPVSAFKSLPKGDTGLVEYVIKSVVSDMVDFLCRKEDFLLSFPYDSPAPPEKPCSASPCGQERCRLGCVCVSLSRKSVRRPRCKNVECIFGCGCDVRNSVVQNRHAAPVTHRRKQILGSADPVAVPPELPDTTKIIGRVPSDVLLSKGTLCSIPAPAKSNSTLSKPPVASMAPLKNNSTSPKPPTVGSTAPLKNNSMSPKPPTVSSTLPLKSSGPPKAKSILIIGSPRKSPLTASVPSSPRRYFGREKIPIPDQALICLTPGFGYVPLKEISSNRVTVEDPFRSGFTIGFTNVREATNWLNSTISAILTNPTPPLRWVVANKSMIENKQLHRLNIETLKSSKRTQPLGTIRAQ